MSNKTWIIRIVLTVSACVGCGDAAEEVPYEERPYEVSWRAEIGSSISNAVAVDASGNVYISGLTFGAPGGHNAGGNDAFLSKFDSSGDELWTRQIGSSDYDHSESVAVDASGNVYITGLTYGDLGGPSADSRISLFKGDAFISKFDSSGNELWRAQIGTSTLDWSKSVTVDASGNVYICGTTRGDLGGPNAGAWDVFVCKFDASGSQLWTNQVGSSSGDWGESVAVTTSGNVYVAGSTEGDFAGQDHVSRRTAFLSKFDSSGELLWAIRFTGGPTTTSAYCVAVDGSENAYVGGSTYIATDRHENDVLLVKFDSAGNHLWRKRFGTVWDDVCEAVTVDAAGDVYISGWTGGTLSKPGVSITDSIDAFVRKFSSSGKEIWTRQVETSRNHKSFSVAVDGSGDVYISGVTGTIKAEEWYLLEGVVDRALIQTMRNRARSHDYGFSAGDAAAFVSRLGPSSGLPTTMMILLAIVAPVTLCLLGLGGLALLKRRSRAHHGGT